MFVPIQQVPTLERLWDNGHQYPTKSGSVFGSAKLQRNSQSKILISSIIPESVLSKNRWTNSLRTLGTRLYRSGVRSIDLVQNPDFQYSHTVKRRISFSVFFLYKADFTLLLAVYCFFIWQMKNAFLKGTKLNWLMRARLNAYLAKLMPRMWHLPCKDLGQHLWRHDWMKEPRQSFLTPNPRSFALTRIVLSKEEEKDTCVGTD